MPGSVYCVILNYNDVVSTSDQIERIRNFKSINHIVVVDNMSTDGSYTKLLEYTSSRITVLRSDKNGGYGSGNNIGIRYAIDHDAGIVIIANPDTIFTDETITYLICKTQNDLECAVGSVLSVKPTGELSKPIAWKKMTAIQEIVSCMWLGSRIMKTRNIKESDILSEDCVKVYAVPGSLMAIDLSKSKIMFDEQVFLFCEEKMVGKMVEDKGYSVKMFPKVSYVHNHSVTIKRNMDYYRIKKTWLTSKAYYIQNYFSLSIIEKILLKSAISIAHIEYRFISVIRRIFCTF